MIEGLHGDWLLAAHASIDDACVGNAGRWRLAAQHNNGLSLDGVERRGQRAAAAGAWAWRGAWATWRRRHRMLNVVDHGRRVRQPTAEARRPAVRPAEVPEQVAGRGVCE